MICRNATHFACQKQCSPMSRRGRTHAPVAVVPARGLRETRRNGGSRHGCQDPGLRRSGNRISPPRRQAAAGARLHAERRGPVSGAGRVSRRRVVPERPLHGEGSPRIHGVARRRFGGAGFSLRQRRPVPGIGAGHQLRGALGEAQCRQAQDAARDGRSVRPVERRAPRDAGRHAAARPALQRDRAAGRFARRSTPPCPA